MSSKFSKSFSLKVLDQNSASYFSEKKRNEEKNHKDLKDIWFEII